MLKPDAASRNTICSLLCRGHGHQLSGYHLLDVKTNHVLPPSRVDLKGSREEHCKQALPCVAKLVGGGGGGGGGG